MKERRFNSYSRYFGELFGSRVQKVAIDAGFGCPSKCTFCNNRAFTPSYCTPAKSITRQIDEGIEFHSRRYRRAERYLAYFQSFSNTFAPLDRLKKIYDEALSHPLVAGIVVGTRPDCVDGAKLDYFAQLAQHHYVAIEYGIESTYDETLKKVNRGHDFAAAKRAVEMTSERGLHTGGHFILGLPGENEQMLVDQVDTINSLPLTTVKFHQLQIFRDTPMADDYVQNPEKFKFWSTPDEYIDFFIEILCRLRPDLVVERFAGECPPRHRLDKGWGAVRNEQLLAMLESRLSERNLHQGCLYRGTESVEQRLHHPQFHKWIWCE